MRWAEEPLGGQGGCRPEGAGEVEILLLLDPSLRQIKDGGAGMVEPPGGCLAECRATKRVSQAIWGEFSLLLPRFGTGGLLFNLDENNIPFNIDLSAD